MGTETSAVSLTQDSSVCAAVPVVEGDDARQVRDDGGGDGACKQREHNADKAICVDQGGDAAGNQHGGHRLIDEHSCPRTLRSKAARDRIARRPRG